MTQPTQPGGEARRGPVRVRRELNTVPDATPIYLFPTQALPSYRCKATQDNTRHDMTRQDITRQDMARQDKTHLGAVPQELVVGGELELLPPRQLRRLLVGEETRSDLGAL